MGGKLIIGVNEKNNNEIVGIETDIKYADNIETLDDWKLKFVELLNGISPVEYRNIILENYNFHKIEDGKTILEVNCPLHDKYINVVSYKGGAKAYRTYKEKNNYKRWGPSTRLMTNDDLIIHVTKKSK